MPALDDYQTRRTNRNRQRRTWRSVDREIQRNEEMLYSLVGPTAAARLALEAHGVREHLQESVLRADRRASNILTDRLDAVLQQRQQNESYEDYVQYNRELIRTIRIFQLYRRFLQWQETELTTSINRAAQNRH